VYVIKLLLLLLLFVRDSAKFAKCINDIYIHYWRKKDDYRIDGREKYHDILYIQFALHSEGDLKNHFITVCLSLSILQCAFCFLFLVFCYFFISCLFAFYPVFLFYVARDKSYVLRKKQEIYSKKYNCQ